MNKLYYTLLAVTIVFALACNDDSIDRDRYGESNWTETTKNSKRKVEKKYSHKDDYEGEDFKNLKYNADIDTNVYRKDYYLESSKRYKFSSNETFDDFKLTVKGRKIHYATIEFSITNSNGERIYQCQFPLMKVLEHVFDGGGEYATFIQKDDYMRAWVDNFFNNENFLSPAINPERSFEPEHVKKQNWDIIAADPSAVGFMFNKGKASQIEIAYDKKQGKVLTYYEY
jgi:hypothetical protein